MQHCQLASWGAAPAATTGQSGHHTTAKRGPERFCASVASLGAVASIRSAVAEYNSINGVGNCLDAAMDTWQPNGGSPNLRHSATTGRDHNGAAPACRNHGQDLPTRPPWCSVQRQQRILQVDQRARVRPCGPATALATAGRYSPGEDTTMTGATPQDQNHRSAPTPYLPKLFP